MSMTVLNMCLEHRPIPPPNATVFYFSYDIRNYFGFKEKYPNARPLGVVWLGGCVNIRPSRFPNETPIPFGPAVAPSQYLRRRITQIGCFGFLYQISAADEAAIFNSVPYTYIRATREVLFSNSNSASPSNRVQALAHFDPLHTQNNNANTINSNVSAWRSGLMQLRVLGCPEWFLNKVWTAIHGKCENDEPLFFPPLRRRSINPPHVQKQMQLAVMQLTAAGKSDAGIVHALDELLDRAQYQSAQASPIVHGVAKPKPSLPALRKPDTLARTAPKSHQPGNGSSSPRLPKSPNLLGPAFGSSSPAAPMPRSSSPLTPYSIRDSPSTAPRVEKRKADEMDPQYVQQKKRQLKAFWDY